MYEVQCLTTRQIAEKLNVGFRTVIRRLRQFGIKPRVQGPPRHELLRDKTWVSHQYLDLGKSSVKIASEIGASNRVVYHWLITHGIVMRQRNQLKGVKKSPEHIRKMAISRRGKCAGADHYNWKGGYVDPTARERRSYKAKQWRDAVKKRDEHKCVECGSTKSLHAHHIKGWQKHPELRYDIDNGLTLCVRHHQKAHGFPFPKWVFDQGESARAPETLDG